MARVIYLIFLVAVAVTAPFVLLVSFAHAKFGDCDPGYYFDARSGIGCKQKSCLEVQYAKYSYEGRCICGSSGSETENPLDANKECYFPQTEATCPGCLVKCVHLNEKCPGEFGVSENEATPSRSWYWMAEDAFSSLMSVGGDLLEAVTGIKLKEDIESDAFYEARVIFPDARQADVRFLHLNLAANQENGFAFEFNVFEIKTPSQGAFIDEWSIGIGLGSVSKDGGSTDVPNTPISPGINFSNIRAWFSDQWTDVRVWWRDNAPWYLGGAEPSPIPGMNKTE